MSQKKPVIAENAKASGNPALENASGKFNFENFPYDEFVREHYEKSAIEIFGIIQKMDNIEESSVDEVLRICLNRCSDRKNKSESYTKLTDVLPEKLAGFNISAFASLLTSGGDGIPKGDAIDLREIFAYTSSDGKVIDLPRPVQFALYQIARKYNRIVVKSTGKLLNGGMPKGK